MTNVYLITMKNYGLFLNLCTLKITPDISTWTAIEPRNSAYFAKGLHNRNFCINVYIRNFL